MPKQQRGQLIWKDELGWYGRFYAIVEGERARVCRTLYTARATSTRLNGRRSTWPRGLSNGATHRARRGAGSPRGESRSFSPSPRCCARCCATRGSGTASHPRV